MKEPGMSDFKAHSVLRMCNNRLAIERFSSACPTPGLDQDTRRYLERLKGNLWGQCQSARV